MMSRNIKIALVKRLKKHKIRLNFSNNSLKLLSSNSVSKDAKNLKVHYSYSQKSIDGLLNLSIMKNNQKR